MAMPLSWVLPNHTCADSALWIPRCSNHRAELPLAWTEKPDPALVSCGPHFSIETSALGAVATGGVASLPHAIKPETIARLRNSFWIFIKKIFQYKISSNYMLYNIHFMQAFPM
jgi:hypothetical protein